MIEARDFVEAARDYGFSWYAGVPCSFLTPFINYVINDDSLSYLSAANEGDALAAAAGATIGGRRAVVMMQNSGLGNAVNPITSLAWVFRIPLLIICTHRGEPGLSDEPQHELMGSITGDLFAAMQVPWEVFPADAGGIPQVLERAHAYMQAEQRPYALLMKKGTVAKHPLRRLAIDVPARCETRRLRLYSGREPRASRHEALQSIIANTSERDAVVIATTGYTGRELFALNDRPNQLYMVGSMGCASALGLGLSLARPDLNVSVVDGDGAALMRMGNLATCGVYGRSNFTHVLLDNETHDSTGAQSTVSGQIRFADIAAGCGYATVVEGDDVEVLERLYRMQHGERARFGHLKIASGTLDGLPRPDSKPATVLQRLSRHIRVSGDLN